MLLRRVSNLYPYSVFVPGLIEGPPFVVSSSPLIVRIESLMASASNLRRFCFHRDLFRGSLM